MKRMAILFLMLSLPSNIYSMERERKGKEKVEAARNPSEERTSRNQGGSFFFDNCGISMVMGSCNSVSFGNVVIGGMPVSTSWNFKEEANHSFDLEPDGILHVKNTSGHIIVTADDQPNVRLEIMKRAATRAGLSHVHALISHEENKLYVETKYNSGAVNAIIDYKIAIPAALTLRKFLENVSGNIIHSGGNGALTAKTVSGDIRVNKYKGAVNFNAVSGDIKATEIEGNVVGTCTSGNICINGIKGKAEVRTVSGDIRIIDCTDKVKVRSTSGQVSIE